MNRAEKSKASCRQPNYPLAYSNPSILTTFQLPSTCRMYWDRRRPGLQRAMETYFSTHSAPLFQFFHLASRMDIQSNFDHFTKVKSSLDHFVQRFVAYPL